MKRLMAGLVLLALCAPLMAQKKTIPLKVEGDTQIIVKSLPFRVVAAPGAHVYVWSHPSTVISTKDRNVLTVTKAPKGVFRVSVSSVTIDFDKKDVIEDQGTIEVIVGDGPVPPTPDPEPIPPQPDPDPAPIPEVGFRVLIVEDIKQRIKLPPEQLDILFNKKVREYLNTKCVADKDGKTRAWRIWPQDVDASSESKTWQDAMKRKRTTTPWIIVSDGKKGYEGPLPKDVDATLELLKKYGEGK